MTSGNQNLLLIKVTVAADAYPGEVTIMLQHVGTRQELWFVPYDSIPNNEKKAMDNDNSKANTLNFFERTFANVPPGELYLAVYDKGGDGICCGYGNGYISVTNARTGHELFRQDGMFGAGMEWYIDINENGKAMWTDTAPRVNDDNTGDGDGYGDGAPLPSPVSNNSGVFHPKTDDPEWPGTLYVPDRGMSTVGITINVKFDSYNEETMWAWSKLIIPNNPTKATMTTEGSNTTSNNNNNSSSIAKVEREATVWKKIDSKPNEGKPNELMSYQQQIDSPGLFRFQVSDTSADGTCCDWGQGYFTITNATGVVWELAGNEFTINTVAYIWVNKQGQTQAVQHVPGLGYVLTTEHNYKSNSSKTSNSSNGNNSTLGGSATVEIVVREV